jgi:hypothetical protein
MIKSNPVLIGVLTVVVANLVARFFFLRRESDPLQKTMKLFRLNLVATGAFCMMLWFLLPSTPSLSTFGYPRSETDIQSTTSLLRYLQDYNQALVRTTEVLHWFLFVFVWWFSTTLFDLTKTLRTRA